MHSDGTQPKVYVDLKGAITGLKLMYVSVYLLETKIYNNVGEEREGLETSIRTRGMVQARKM